MAVADRLKLGWGIVTAIVVVFVALPEVPVIWIGYVPGVAVALAVAVNRTDAPGATEGQFIVTATPAGAPEIARLTTLPLSPTSLTTERTLVAPVPPARTVSALGELARLKLGWGMVSAIVELLVSAPEVPVTINL